MRDEDKKCIDEFEHGISEIIDLIREGSIIGITQEFKDGGSPLVPLADKDGRILGTRNTDIPTILFDTNVDPNALNSLVGLALKKYNECSSR